MPATLHVEEFSSRRGLRCRASIRYGNQIWRGVTWVSNLESVSIDGVAQPVPTFGEGCAVTLQLDSAVLGQMTTIAKVILLTIHSRAGNSASARIDIVPLQRDDVSCIAFKARIAELKPLILYIGAGEGLREGDFPGFRVEEVVTEDEVARLLEEDEVAVVVFGQAVKPLELRALLQGRSQEALSRSVHIVLYDKTLPSAFQDLVDEDSIFYLAHASIAANELRAIVFAALRKYERQLKLPVSTTLTDEENERVTEMTSRLARKRDLPTLVRAISEELKEFLQATQARCLFYDLQTDTLCTKGVEEGELEPISAAAGLVGYVARTGERVRTEMAGEDPRYDPEADDPGGSLDAHFIAQPLTGTGGTTMGVLTATRTARSSPFTADDENRIELLSSRMTPLLNVLLEDTRLRQKNTLGDDLERDLFRKEALEYEDQGESEGKLQKGIPLWLRWSNLLIILFMAISIAYLMLARVHQVVTGPAVIQVMNKTAVVAQSSGVVARLLVSTNERVTEGELLGTLQTAPGDSLLERMRKEVHAPVDGVVSSISIRAGQQVTSGEQLVSLTGEGSSNEVLVLLPGSYAPEIHAGMPLVLKIDGYPQSREELTILDVAPDIVGPGDAERYVGKEIAQTLSLSGPILMVHTALPLDSFDTFEATNEKFLYHDGMVARAEVSVRREPLITALIPGIKRFYGEPRISLWHTAGLWGKL